MVFESLLAAIVIAPIASGVTFLTNLAIEERRKTRAYRRLVDDSYVYVGARLEALQSFDRDEPLFAGEAVITKLERGRVEITVVEECHPYIGCVFAFTGRELERLVPVHVPVTSPLHPNYVSDEAV